MSEPHAIQIAQFERARLSRDARFDGLFFIAVSSTGIYCRPICPAPSPKARNVRYFQHAAAAAAAGYRPCLRCRPELAPGLAPCDSGDRLFDRALRQIDNGALETLSLAQLAAELGVSDRHLRRLFEARLGVSPLALHANRRLLLAKQLLSETRLSVTEIALASGFRSLRRFNAAFLEHCGMPPSRVREGRRSGQAAGSDGPIELRLAYRPPYALQPLLAFLATRAMPGVERVDAHSYSRTLGSAEQPGWLRVEPWPGQHALRVTLQLPDLARLPEVLRRVRRLFDLDADPSAIAGVLGADPALADSLLAEPGLRVPGAYDGFEAAVRAVLGQQVSVAAASTLASRLVQRFGVPIDSGLPGLDRLFPSPACMADADVQAVGLTRSRAQTLRHLALTVARGDLVFDTTQPLDDWTERAMSLPGIGPWTAHYMALRALHHPDAWPAGDLVVRQQLGGGEPISESAARARADVWRPWRGYAVMHLWRQANLARGKSSTHKEIA